MKKLFTLFLCGLLLLTACGNRMPEGVPDDFAVYYAMGIDTTQMNILDTYESYIQKDLIMDGTAKTEYTPSDEVILAIYNKIVELELWKLPADVRPDDRIIEPTTYFEIRFTINGRTYEILADSTISHSTWLNKNITAEEGETIQKFCIFMMNILMETEEYKSLPETRGGYQ